MATTLGLFSLSLVGILVYARSQGPRFPAREFSVMTFNLRNSRLGDTGTLAWEARKPLAMDLLTWQGPDIVGFQEVSRVQRSDLSHALSDYDHVGAGRDGGGQGEQCPIFWKRDRLEKLASGTFWLSSTPLQPGVGWDAQLPRICTWVQYSGLTVFNAHLDHAGPESRRQSLKLIRGLVRGPVVVMGDFNDAQGSLALEPVDDLVDAFGRAGSSPQETFHNFYGKPEEEGARIDFIFVSPDIEVLSADVVDSEARASDHYPVMVRMRQKASP